MGDVVFWKGVKKEDEVREAIMSADFAQVRALLRAADYRPIIIANGYTDECVDQVRDSLETDDNCLHQARLALLKIYHASESGDDHDVKMAGLHLRQALSSLVDKNADRSQDCPVVPLGQQLARKVLAVAA